MIRGRFIRTFENENRKPSREVSPYLSADRNFISRAHRRRFRLRGERILVSLNGKADNIVTLTPPLTFGHAHADTLLDALDRILAEHAAATDPVALEKILGPYGIKVPGQDMSRNRSGNKAVNMSSSSSIANTSVGNSSKKGSEGRLAALDSNNHISNSSSSSSRIRSSDNSDARESRSITAVRNAGSHLGQNPNSITGSSSSEAEMQSTSGYSSGTGDAGSSGKGSSGFNSSNDGGSGNGSGTGSGYSSGSGSSQKNDYSDSSCDSSDLERYAALD